MFDLRSGTVNCPICKMETPVGKVVVIGSHVCSRQTCESCETDFLCDLPTAHGTLFPNQLDAKTNILYGDVIAKSWFGIPLQEAWKTPNHKQVDVGVEKLTTAEDVVFVPCIDYYYGHAVLKLLSISGLLKGNASVIVLVPKWLRWLVPEGVAEIWTVDIPLRKGQNYFPSVSEQVCKELARFNSVKLGEARAHPDVGNPEEFTGVKKHSWDDEKFRISYIWRDDRLWVPEGILGKIFYRFPRLGRFVQKRRIVSIMKLLQKAKLSNVKFTMITIGNSPKMPKWIDNQTFLPPLQKKSEQELCRLYSESRVVIGIHGSNMLLPSWHAGATFDLMPNDRWGNFGQDILFNEENPRHAAIRYKFSPMSCSISNLAIQIYSIIRDYSVQRESFK